MNKHPITRNTLILEIVENFPQAIPVFNERNMSCPGCCISSYHTVADSAREYDLPADELLLALNAALIPAAAHH